jgi:outer membrane biosynthesis protein TonB
MKQYIETVIVASFLVCPMVLLAQESRSTNEQGRHPRELSLMQSDSSIASTIGVQDHGLAQQYEKVQRTQTFDQPPEAISVVDPKYPEAARLQKLEGTVWIKIWVDEGGRPGSISIMSSDA